MPTPVGPTRAINLSLRGPKDPLITNLVKEAFSQNIVVVAAAGDKGLTNYPPYPAALPEVIAVAAVDIKWKPYAEGIKGDFVTLCAPGVDPTRGQIQLLHRHLHGRSLCDRCRGPPVAKVPPSKPTKGAVSLGAVSKRLRGTWQR